MTFDPIIRNCLLYTRESSQTCKASFRDAAKMCCFFLFQHGYKNMFLVLDDDDDEVVSHVLTYHVPRSPLILSHPLSSKSQEAV